MNAKASSPTPGTGADTTKIESPSGLDLNPRPPRTVRVSKRAAGLLLAVAAVVLGLFAYGGYKRQQRQVQAFADKNAAHNVSPASAAAAEITKDVPSGNVPNVPASRSTSGQTGVLQVPSDLPGSFTPNANGAGPSQVFVRQAPGPAPQATPQIAPAREPSPEERRLLNAFQQEQQAIVAPTTSRTGFATNSGIGSQFSAGGGRSDESATVAALMDAISRQGGGTERNREFAGRNSLPREIASNDNSLNGQDRKESFLEKARSEHGYDYLKSTRTLPLSSFEIKAGWEIPALLEQALNSDLPGELKALVTSNVYDTASGRYVLIPQGSRLVGLYNSRVGYGQDGVQVIWNRVIYPDGSSLDLSGMIGQDAHGLSGFRDKVDRHYKRLVGFAVLTSLFAAAAEISQNRNQSLLTYPSPGQVAGSAVGQQVSELGAQITRRNLDVQPTVKIPAGYRFNVRVNRDIVFDGPYETSETARQLH